MWPADTKKAHMRPPTQFEFETPALNDLFEKEFD
jgi:hypothetical protein